VTTTQTAGYGTTESPRGVHARAINAAPVVTRYVIACVVQNDPASPLLLKLTDYVK
jgi:hypothetical protein